jgi:hypothetical protein
MPIKKETYQSPIYSDSRETSLRNLDDVELQELIAQAEEDKQAGRTISHEEVKARIGFTSPTR